MGKKLLFASIVFLVVIGLLEVAARMVEKRIETPPLSGKNDGWQTVFFRSMFSWHEPDPRLLWHFRPNLQGKLIHTNEAGLISAPATKKKPPDSYRVLLLGDSSPVGLGLKSYHESFGELLEFRLQQAMLGSRKVELVNSAVSGYSSAQCRLFLELEGWQYDPDLVIVYCGNNDASISGPKSDRELLEAQHLVDVRRGLSHLALYRAMRSLLADIRGRASAPNSSKLKVRVSPEEYRENIAAIAEACREKNVPLLILKPPVPLCWPAGLQFAVFADVSDSSGRMILPPQLQHALGRDIKYCLETSRVTDTANRPDWFTTTAYSMAFQDNMSPQEALDYYSKEIVNTPDDPVAVNNLGVTYWQMAEYDRADSILLHAREEYVTLHDVANDPLDISAGAPFLFNIAGNRLRGEMVTYDIESVDPGGAAVYFDSALQADYFSLRIKREYLEKLDWMQNGRQTLVVDLPAVFNTNGNERLFVDHCHPTAEGHRLIADEIMRVLRNIGIVSDRNDVSGHDNVSAHAQ